MMQRPRRRAFAFFLFLLILMVALAFLVGKSCGPKAATAGASPLVLPVTMAL
ncbi:MAG: hypothetical protein ACREJQ_03900 [bacterium]